MKRAEKAGFQSGGNFEDTDGQTPEKAVMMFLCSSLNTHAREMGGATAYTPTKTGPRGTLDNAMQTAQQREERSADGRWAVVCVYVWSCSHVC